MVATQRRRLTAKPIYSGICERSPPLGHLFIGIPRYRRRPVDKREDTAQRSPAPLIRHRRDERVRQFEGIARAAKRKLEALNAAHRLDDLAKPPSNRLEKLKGNLKEFHSIRINDQWRLIFKWMSEEPYEVRIVDYH